MAKRKTTSDITVTDIDQVTAVLSKLIIKGEFVHMKRPVEMVLGGMLIPFLKKAAGDSEPNADIDALIEQFSAEKIAKMLDPDAKIIEVPIDRIVETIKLIRGKFRRVKTDVIKEKRKVRTLDTLGRDTLIRWWNVNQRLVPDGDPVCVTLTAQINAQKPHEDPLSNMQVSGYFSYLCRLGRATAKDRDRLITRSLKKGMTTIRPTYSPALLRLIGENWEAERADEKLRHADHMELLERRANGDRTPICVEVTR